MNEQVNNNNNIDENINENIHTYQLASNMHRNFPIQQTSKYQ